MIDHIGNCTRCPLSTHQKPILDHRRQADVIWLGISGKSTSSQFQKPLDPNTISGQIIEQIEKQLPSINFYSSNLVKCAPINNNGKLRYPSAKEINACSYNLQVEIEELQPKVLVLLGEKVANSLIDSTELKLEPKNQFIRSITKNNNTIYIAATHPSYIYVYKRKFINEYINTIKNLLHKIILNNE